MPITAFDTNRDVRPFLPWLKAQGFTTAIRYYTALAGPKRLGLAEAQAIVAAGLRLTVVYQDRGNEASDFSEVRGQRAGATALDYAMQQIGQPADSTLYFSVDFDASRTAIRDHIVPHFRAIRAALTLPGEAAPFYKVGAYGSGLLLRLLTEAGLIERCWLSMSMGFRESRQFFDSGAWHLHQKPEVHNAPTPAGPFSYDPDEIGTGGCGDFTIELPAPVAPRWRVNARSGLLLRKGPGVEFGRIRSLPVGTEVLVLDRSGDWALVDLQGDGLADGYCHGGFLAQVTDA